jgi:dethiobiotin synthetase
MTSDTASRAPRGFFVTGTDTGVGKTVMTCALLHALAGRGRRVLGMKPVAAGAIQNATGWINDDVAMLRSAGNVHAVAELINPFCFEPAVAPHIAAAQAGVTIDLDTIASAFEQLAALADLVMVEGVGGFCVPLNECEDSADLALRLRLPVVLVVGLRLGCINHALLTAQAIRTRGLTLAGWVANQIDPGMREVEANIAAIQARIRAPLLAGIGFSRPADPRRIAAELDLTPLAVRA